MARGDVERFWDGDAVIVTPRSSDNRLSAWKQPAVPVLADFCIPESEPLAAKRSRSMEPSFLWLICSFCFCAVMMFGTAALLLYPVAKERVEVSSVPFGAVPAGPARNASATGSHSDIQKDLTNAAATFPEPPDILGPTRDPVPRPAPK